MEKNPSNSVNKKTILPIEKLRSVFHIPLKNSHIILGVGQKTIQNSMVEHKIERWPYRKIKSMKKARYELMNLQNNKYLKQRKVLLDDINLTIRNLYLDPNIPIQRHVKDARNYLCKYKHKIKKRTIHHKSKS